MHSEHVLMWLTLARVAKKEGVLFLLPLRRLDARVDRGAIDDSHGHCECALADVRSTASLVIVCGDMGPLASPVKEGGSGMPADILLLAAT